MSPVVLLHGFTHTGASWQPVVDALGEGHHTQAPDIRGHGSASELRPVDLPGVLSDLTDLMAEQPVLVGYSMGGRVALHLALAEPDRVRRLILIGASPGLANPTERQARLQADHQLAARIERSRIEEFADRWARTPVLAGLSPEVAERVHRDRLKNTPAGLARALRGLGTGALPSLWGRLGELNLPTTLVVGERDQKFQAIAHQMAGLLPQAELIVVTGTGHAVHLEAPGRVAQIISTDPGGDPR